jgi:hypothetical protein
MVGFRRSDFLTCANALVSYSVPIRALCRDWNRSRGLHRRPWRPRWRSGRCGGHTGLRAGRRGDWRDRCSALDGGRTAGGLVRADGSLGWARLSAWRLRRLRTTDLGGGCGCQTCSCGSAGTGRSALLCPRWGSGWGSRLSPRGRARLHRLTSLLPGRSDRTGLRDRRIRPTGCGWQRLRGRNPRLLRGRGRRRSHAALRPLGLPSESEPGQEALFGRWRLRRIPYRYATISGLHSRGPWGRRRRNTRLGLCGSVRRLAAGLRLWSWLSRRRLALLWLSRRRLALLWLSRRRLALLWSSRRRLALLWSSRRRLDLLRPRRGGRTLFRLRWRWRGLFLLRWRWGGLFLLRRWWRRLLLRGLRPRLMFLADRRSCRGSAARCRLRSGGRPRRRVGLARTSRSGPSGWERTRGR